MQTLKRAVTAEEFEAFVNLPENADRTFELVAGEIVEVPSNPYASQIAARISMYIGMYLLQHNIGHVTGEAGGYIVSGERYAPDVAYISKPRQPELARAGYNPNPPDLAVEVVFPTAPETARLLTVKVANYLAAGTVVWVVYPETKEVEVFAPGQPAHILNREGTLEGGELLPGFSLAVSAIFPDEPAAAP